MTPVALQLKLLKRLAPDVKSVGILFNTSEVNSEFQIRWAKEAAAELEAALASEATFREAGGRFGQTTNFVAMLGLAIGEHPETSPLKSRCGSIRDAAAALKQARSYEASKQAWPRLQTALAGEGPELAVVPAGWTQFGGLGGLMSEFNGRTMRLRRAVRFPKDPAVESRDALAMALLASATRFPGTSA